MTYYIKKNYLLIKKHNFLLPGETITHKFAAKYLNDYGKTTHSIFNWCWY